MLNPHSPFHDSFQHVANEYCPTCHGATQNIYTQQQNVASSSPKSNKLIQGVHGDFDN
jgi:hypothetical protein